MAGTPDNMLLDILPKILASALNTLREEAVIPQLVNGDYSAQAAQRGAVIDVPVPTAIEAQEVEPGPYSQSVEDLDIKTVPIELNNWFEAPFALTDKDMLEIMNGVPNMQIQEAARAIANKVANSVYALHKQMYNTVGTPGTGLFVTDTSEAVDARKYLNRHMAPTANRRIILDVDNEANAVKLMQFQSVDYSGTNITIQEAVIGRKIGFDWFYDQLMPTHDAGTVAAAAGPAPTLAYVGGNPYSTTSVADLNSTGIARHNPRERFVVRVDNVAAGGAVKVGDLFRVAGDTQTYVVKADSALSGGNLDIIFEPKPKVVWADNAAVTFLGDHSVSMAFHRDSIALAMRPLTDAAFQQELGGSMTMTLQDPITRIPLRCEVRREWKRLRWSLDALWGCALLRPTHAVKLIS